MPFADISQSPTQLRMWRARAVQKFCGGMKRWSYCLVPSRSPIRPAIWPRH